MFKQIVLSCLCLTLLFGACKKDMQVVNYYSHNDSFPPSYIDTLLGQYGCVMYSVNHYTDTLGISHVSYDSMHFQKVTVIRKAFDIQPNSLYFIGFAFEDISCKVDSLKFNGGYSDFNWTRNISGFFNKQDSIYIDINEGHLGRAFYAFRGKRV